MTDHDRRRILTDWRRSGLSAIEFAATVDLSPWTLYAWRRKLGTSDSSAARRAPKFLELVAEAPPAVAGRCLAVELPRGITVHVGRDFDADLLRRAVDALLA